MTGLPRTHPFPELGDNRDPEPCPDGECKHTFDHWPAGSVTRRDLELDQCGICGWTEIEVTARRLAAPPRTDTLRGIMPPRAPAIEDTVVVDTDPDDEITAVMVMPRAVCIRCGYRARHVTTFLNGTCGLCADPEATS